MPRTAKHWDSKRYAIYRNQFKKTQLCKYYAVGSCTKGEECNFAHGNGEMNHLPNLAKTALCEDFQRGKCFLTAEQCSYAHGQDELRRSTAFESIRKAGTEEVSTPASPGSLQKDRSGQSPDAKKAAKKANKSKPKLRSMTTIETMSTCSGSGSTSSDPIYAPRPIDTEQEMLHDTLQQLRRTQLHLNMQAQEALDAEGSQLPQRHCMPLAALQGQRQYPPLNAYSPAAPCDLMDFMGRGQPHSQHQVAEASAHNMKLLALLRERYHWTACKAQGLNPAKVPAPTSQSTGFDAMYVPWSELGSFSRSDPAILRL